MFARIFARFRRPASRTAERAGRIVSTRIPPKLRAAVALAGALIVLPESASAVPSFAVQTNQPCSACHIGAFGPRLKQAGRDFKLYGYSATDMQKHGLPIAAIAYFSFTHTSKDEVSAALEGYSKNDNAAVDDVSMYYGGKITDNVGALIEVAYDAVAKTLGWGDFDVRYARDLTVSGSDLVLGATLNNGPSEADLWEAQPNWSFPFVSSPLADSPQAAPLTNLMVNTVIGAGIYADWDSTLYVELNAYNGLGRNALNFVGAGRINGTDALNGPAPYWRVALDREFDDGVHYVELGTYGLAADIYPEQIQTAGSDRFNNEAFDFTYQWIPHPDLSTSDALSFRMEYLLENASLGASRQLFGGPSGERLTQFHADVTYSFDASYTPTLQYFRTSGTADPVRWTATPAGIPDSNGWIAEFDFVPWGKPDSSAEWYNARAALQYVAYSKFDGATADASANNTLYFSLALAIAPGGFL